MKESNVKNKTYLTIKYKDHTKKLIPILQQKWKYLKMWNENISKCEMKISQNVKQDTSSSENSSQTVEIRNKTNERKQCQKQNIFNNKLER